MGAELRFHFGLGKKGDCNEFQQHISLAAQLLANPDIKLQTVKIFEGSISETYLNETLNSFDQGLIDKMKTVRDSNLVLVTRFAVSRSMNSGLNEHTGKIGRADEGVLCDLVTVGNRSTIMRPFETINSWWSVGPQKNFEAWGSKRTWRENRRRLLSELEIIASAADRSVVVGGGGAWPDNPRDIFFLSVSSMACDVYNLLEVADQMGSVEVEERAKCIYMYTSGSWATSIEPFLNRLASRNFEIGYGL